MSAALDQHDHPDQKPAAEVGDENTFQSADALVQNAHEMGLESGRYSAYGDDTHQPVETHAATILSPAFLYETDFTKLWHFFDNS
jgi:hypothetical protein